MYKLISILLLVIFFTSCGTQKNTSGKAAAAITATNTTEEYKAQVINTSFTVPILRFNTISSGAATNNQIGNVSLFNSVGAGISYNWGRIEETTDNNGTIINTEMMNTAGIQVGFLFAVNSSSGNNANIFAPTLSLSILNFNFGMGYELGNLPTGEKRLFYTIAYGIPTSKLLKGGFFLVSRKSIPATDIPNAFR